MDRFTPSAANSEYWNKRMDVPMVLVSALVIPSLLLEFTATSSVALLVGVLLNWGIWIAFIVEYAIGLKVAPDRRRFVTTHILDGTIIVLTVPFLPAIASSVRLLRLLRLSRLLRLKPLIVWMMENSGERYVAGFAVVVVLVSGLTFSQIEGIPFGDGVYWAITTVTTVGYGDYLPQKPESKLLASVVMIIGISAFASLSAILAGRVIGMHQAEDEQEQKVDHRLLMAELERLSNEVNRLSSFIEADSGKPGRS